MSSDLTLPVRITAARRLLSEGMEEFHDLPPQCQAHLQEAIEFLTQVEERLDGIDGGPGGNGTDVARNGTDAPGEGTDDAGTGTGVEADGSDFEGAGGKK